MDKNIKVLSAILLMVATLLLITSCVGNGKNETTADETTTDEPATEPQTAVPVEAKPFTNFKDYLTQIDFSYSTIEIAEINSEDIYMAVPLSKSARKANAIVKYNLETGKTRTVYTLPDKSTVISKLSVNDDCLLYVTSRQDGSRQRVYARNLKTGSTRLIYSGAKADDAVCPVLYNQKVYWIEKRGENQPALCSYNIANGEKSEVLSLSSRRADVSLSINEGRLLSIDTVSGTPVLVIYDILNAEKTIIPTGAYNIKDAMLTGRFLIYSEYDRYRLVETDEENKENDEENEEEIEGDDEKETKAPQRGAWVTRILNLDALKYYSDEESEIFQGVMRASADRFVAVMKNALRFYLSGEKRISYMFTLPERNITCFAPDSMGRFVVAGKHGEKSEKSGSFVIIVNMNGYFEKV